LSRLLQASTTGRPQTIETPLGRFEFRHVSKKYFWGYQQVELKFGQTAFIAHPEKALLDLIYLTPGGDEFEFIKELRLQNFEQINRAVLHEFVERFQSPKLNREPPTHGFSVRCLGCNCCFYNRLQCIFSSKMRITSG